MSPTTFHFLVPLEWPDFPYRPGTSPTAWLAEDGGTVTEEGKAVVFQFRLDPTGREEIQIEARLDSVNGGIGETVDLEIAIGRTQASLRMRYEAQLWPDGRPVAANATEAQAQQDAIDGLFAIEGKDKLVLSRMHELRDRQQMAAEWAVLIVDPPPGWGDIADRRTPREVLSAIGVAYKRARNLEGQAAGKARRSER